METVWLTVTVTKFLQEQQLSFYPALTENSGIGKIREFHCSLS